DDAAIDAAAEEVMAAIDAAVIEERHGPGWPGAHGISIYFPVDGYDSRYDGSANFLVFTAANRWDEWLHAYYSGGGAACLDPREPNNSTAAASAIAYGATIADADICSDSDADYYAFSGSAGDVIVASTAAATEGSALDSYLSLIDTDGTTQLAYDDDSGDETDSLLIYTLDETGVYYLKVRDYSILGGPEYFYSLSLQKSPEAGCEAALAAFDAQYPVQTTLNPQSSELPLLMPPHPDLLRRYRLGEIDLPDLALDPTLRNARGIDLPQVVGPRAAGQFKTLALLVRFTDQPSQVGAAYFDSLLFGGGEGSLNDYYDQVSYGQMDIVTVNLPSAIDWCTMALPYSFYVDEEYGWGGYPNNAQKLAEDAVVMANSLVDFSQYDNDDDGWVDTVFIIHAGRGAEFTGSEDDIWSHSWNTLNAPLVDGVMVGSYTTEPEYWVLANDMTVGVFAHELGHALGLPDLYDYGHDSNGIGDWSLMAGGSWNGVHGDSPAFLDAWSRVELGFSSLTNVLSNTLAASIPAAETSPTVFRLWTRGAAGLEYFLVENRQLSGYDQALPGAGLLIWHIDESISGNDHQCSLLNNWLCGANYQVALEQADGAFHLEWNLGSGPGDPFPGDSNNHEFTFTSVPNSSSYTGSADTLVRVSNISPSAPVMTADLYVDTILVCSALNEPNNDPLHATALAYGGLVDGQICSPGDEDFFAFTGSAGDVLVASASTANPNSDLDPELALYAGDGVTLLATVNDSGSSLDPRLAYVLPSAGVYYLRVREHNHPGEGGP
ncbi:MAG: M6 family metalloprotease domain-containing protein, partial [Chloroflexi bacterium]